MSFRAPLAAAVFTIQGALGASAAPIAISQITEVDALGYTCISGEYLEETDGVAAVAFTLTGKIRMPRTCLPDPCEGALSRTELSQLTGTEMILPRFQNEWDDYYARYAEHCRKETVAFADPETQPTRTSPDDFWAPILANAASGRTATAGPAATSSAGVIPIASVVTTSTKSPEERVLNETLSSTPETPETPPNPPETQNGGGTNGNPPEPPETPNPPVPPETPNPPEQPPIVPLPTSGVLMLAGLGALALTRRRKQSQA